MNPSVFPLIFALILSQRFLNFAKINNHQQWVRLFSYSKYFAIFLFATEVILKATETIRWIWHIYLIAMVLFALKQKEMRALQMFILAFVPYVFVSFFSNLAEVTINDIYNKWDNYFYIAKTLTFMWLVAIFFSQHKQNKAAEKERIKRQKEDEINRAIAQRKVELEGLVAERTAELSQQKQELEHTLEELRASQTQLIHSEKMASLGELTAGIAHEIQNPLNFVNNFSEVNNELIDEMKEELAEVSRQLAAGSKQLGEEKLKLAEEIANDIKQNLGKINHHGKRADAIVKGMLLHSRASSGIKEPADINALADEYLRLAYHGLRAKDKSFNATMKTDFDERVGKINVIQQDMGRVILNLITNAFYAVSEKQKGLALQNKSETEEPKVNYEPTVTVKTVYQPPTGNKKGACVISVSDNGNGIPEEVIDKIFQPFFTTKPTGQGTGLGLSISYDIVTKAHNGQLKVENHTTRPARSDGEEHAVQGAGATFTIVLPLE